MAVLFDPNESRDRRIKMLLDTATSAMQIQNQKREIDLKERELDPRVQAGKMANMMALMGNPEGAAKMFEYSKSGNLPTGGIQLPSQVTQEPIIPDYLAGGQNRINSQVAGLSPAMTGMGVTGGTMKVGGASMKFGKPGMSKYDEANLDIQKGLVTKNLEATQQRQSGAEKTLTGLDVYMQQFKRSEDELKKYDPNIGKEGFEGKLSRIGGIISEKLDELPETSAMIAMSKPFAQEIATDLEGRATDQDRNIQIETMANLLKGPSTKNIRLASNAIISLQAKGANTKKMVSKMYNSGSDILQKAAEQVYEVYPELRDKSSSLEGLFDGI